MSTHIPPYDLDHIRHNYQLSSWTLFQGNGHLFVLTDNSVPVGTTNKNFPGIDSPSGTIPHPSLVTSPAFTTLSKDDPQQPNLSKEVNTVSFK